jgi:dTDP-4-dehydrorhamnose reductase
LKLLVTGAGGMLGLDLCRHLAEAGHTVLAGTRAVVDVRDWARVQCVFAEFRPDQVYHLAALTDVDRCEREPEAALHTNVLGTQHVALACQAAGVPLVYVSTIAVFDGHKPEAYTEFDAPNPQSWYARSKHQGEAAVHELAHKHYIVRAGWMFGGGSEDKKFVARILHLAQTQRTLKVVDDKFGSPTYTRDLARALSTLSDTGLFGLYHLVNTGAPASRFEIAQHILREAGITDCELMPVSSAEFPLPAPRPRMEAGRNLRAELLGLDWMRPWPAALAEYVRELTA